MERLGEVRRKFSNENGVSSNKELWEDMGLISRTKDNTEKMSQNQKKRNRKNE